MTVIPSCSIDTPDTFGFLYEFTNALALTRTYIARMIVQSIGSRAQDILHVTDENGNKITSPEKQRELRAAVVLIKHFTHLLATFTQPIHCAAALSRIPCPALSTSQLVR